VVGVVGAEDPLAVGQGALEQRDRLGRPACGLVGGGDVIPERGWDDCAPLPVRVAC